MSDEFHAIPFPGKIVILNPDLPRQVRQVSGVGSPAWVLMTSAVFSECAIPLVQLGATGKYYADFPAGLDADISYEFLLYDSAASAFSDIAELMEYIGDMAGSSTVEFENT